MRYGTALQNNRNKEDARLAVDGDNQTYSTTRSSRGNPYWSVNIETDTKPVKWLEVILEPGEFYWNRLNTITVITRIEPVGEPYREVCLSPLKRKLKNFQKPN